MVFPNKAAQIIIERIPELVKTNHWENFYVFMDYKDNQESLKICGVMNALTCYVEDMLNTSHITMEKQKEVEKIFLLIEFFLNEGDQHVQNALATCFLENLINDASSGRIKPESFISLLGEQSKLYCKAWDGFTGVKTKGL